MSCPCGIFGEGGAGLSEAGAYAADERTADRRAWLVRCLTSCLELSIVKRGTKPAQGMIQRKGQ